VLVGEKKNNNKRTINKKLTSQCECNNDARQPRELNTTKFAHEFRAATLELNAEQCEVKLILTLFHKRYIKRIKVSQIGSQQRSLMIVAGFYLDHIPQGRTITLAQNKTNKNKMKLTSSRHKSTY